MTCIILFEDNPDAAPDIRKAHMAQHLAFLEARADVVRAAGPLSDPDAKGRDGLWIVEANSIEDIQKLIHADPFWPTGLRKSYTILPWRRVFADGHRLINPA